MASVIRTAAPSEAATAPPYIHFLDAVAGIAILRVVTLHSLANYTVAGCKFTLDITKHGLDYRLTNSLLQFSVPVFVLLSGIKFGLKLHLVGSIDLKQYLPRRSWRILRPYFVFTMIYILYQQSYIFIGRLILTGRLEYAFPSIKNLIRMVLGPDNPGYQLWFLLMLFTVNVIYLFWVRLFTAAPVRLAMSAAVFIIIHLHGFTYPLNFLRYILLFDLGAVLGPRLLSVPAAWWRWPSAAALISTSAAIVYRSLGVDRTLIHCVEAVMELSVPLLMVLPFAAFDIRKGPGILVRLGKNAMAVYVLHDPIILNLAGKFLYRIFHLVSPAVVPIVAIVALCASLAAARILNRNRLTRLLL